MLKFITLVLPVLAVISMVPAMILRGEGLASVLSQQARDTLGLKSKSGDDWTVVYILLCMGILLYMFFVWLDIQSKRRYFERVRHDEEFNKRMRLADIRLERKRREFEKGLIDYFEKLLRESMRTSARLKVKSAKDMSELKYLFRDLALKYHPDKSRNEGERKLYEFLMKKINIAYASGDLYELKQIDRLYEEHKSEFF
jgi:hypothetical protein